MRVEDVDGCIKRQVTLPNKAVVSSAYYSHTRRYGLVYCPVAYHSESLSPHQFAHACVHPLGEAGLTL